MLYEREIDLIRTCDVLVAGAGPSGIAASLEAARKGLDVVLLERGGYVGGMMTSSMVTTLMGGVSKGTIADEVASLLGAKDASTAINVEEARVLLEDLLCTNGVHLMLLTTLIDAIVQERKICHAIVKTKTGLHAIDAKVFIDATGDGELAAASGCGYEYGREDSLVQPVSIMYHIAGVDPGSTVQCTHEEDDFITTKGTSYLKESERAEAEGRLPKDVSIVRLYRGKTPGEYLVNATQKGRVNTLDVDQLTEAAIELRRQLGSINEFIREYAPGFENIYTLRSADVIGVRESRHVNGQYRMNADDIIEGHKFPDVVVHNAKFPIDIHNPVGGGQAETDTIPIQGQQYDIPMRALLPVDIDNLILCGRCISGTHRAHASYRVMRIAMATGQAAGAMASVMTRTGKVDYESVRGILQSDGVDLGE